MIFKNIILNGSETDITVENGKIKTIGKNSESGIDCKGLTALPSLVDLHVHFRDPGLTHKETVLTGSLAARNGGFSDVFCMPNTKPVCDCRAVAEYIFNAKANVNVHPVCAITKDQKGAELCDFAEYKELGIFAVSDDGMPVFDDEIFEKAMISAKKNGLLIISHCENKSYVTDRLNIPSEAEFTDVIRVLKLASKTNASVHLAHISTKESVKAIREAKKAGIDVTAETCPHYFTLTSDAFKQFGANAMMNPPLRFQEDIYAVTEAIADGIFDIISTDHAPHSAAEKSVEPQKAPFGITGLETSFPLSYTMLVKKGVITLDELISKMSVNPSKRVSIATNGITVGSEANFFVADLSTEFVFNAEKSLSKSRNTPFDGRKMTGRAVYNILKGEIFECQQIF